MAVSITTINIGTTGGDGSGHTAFVGGGYINQNFTNLKTAVDGFTSDGIYHTEATDDSLGFSGGSSFILGANIVLYGENHATQADDIEFRVDATPVLSYDASGDTNNGLWSFLDKAVEFGNGNVRIDAGGALERTVDNSSLSIYGSTDGITGSGLQLFGSAHATTASDIRFWAGGSQQFYYDYSATTWDFQNNHVTLGGVLTIDTAVAVSGLPGTPALGMIKHVSDADTPAVGSTVVGSGASPALVWYNGTNWTVIGV